MLLYKNKKNKVVHEQGFVILFAVIITSIVLLVSLGIANVVYKETLLSSSSRDGGYAFFAAKNKSQATTYFNKVINSKTYAAQAKYYLGFMAYEGDDYKNANKYFDQVAEDDKFKEKLSYFQADMSFKSGNFQKAIDLGSVSLAKSNALEKSELNKIKYLL